MPNSIRNIKLKLTATHSRSVLTTGILVNKILFHYTYVDYNMQIYKSQPDLEMKWNGMMDIEPQLAERGIFS